MSLAYLFETTEKPVNCFRNQIILKEGWFPSRRDLIVFAKKRHIIKFADRNCLIRQLKMVINPEVVNAIYQYWQVYKMNWSGSFRQRSFGTAKTWCWIFLERMTRGT